MGTDRGVLNVREESSMHAGMSFFRSGTLMCPPDIQDILPEIQEYVFYVKRTHVMDFEQTYVLYVQ